MEYAFAGIEQWARQFWEENSVYKVSEDAAKPKYYVLDMFPYPSGAGLHVGHPLGYIASDIVARFKRLKGYNVLHPMGYDSFGLPAEQYAIQTGQHPAVTTEQNIKRYREQLDKIGYCFDWSREVRTSNPDYYKWTQWIFIQIFNSWYNRDTDKAERITTLITEFEKSGNTKVNAVCADTMPFTAEEWKAYSEKEQQQLLMNYRLAYLGEAYVNWCPALGTVLANDEVKDGVSERGGYPVERKLMKQWSMRITAYGDRLLKGLDTIDWSEAMKETQRNWIGKSEGCSVAFKVDSTNYTVEVFTTRPDTIFGVTFITLSPEHELIDKITTPDQREAVEAYVLYAKNRSERERMTEVKKVTGQFTGAYVIHPFTNEKVPIWIGEYVLSGYGTGAVMGVPAHDSRDYAFAKYFALPIKEVVSGGDISKESYDAKEGTLVNSGFLNGLDVKQAVSKAIQEIENKGIGKGRVNYKLRDTVFGRQRYWGEPIPIYYKEGIPYAVDEKDLPIVLPEIDQYKPTESGEPPLARADDFNYRPHPNPPRGGGSRSVEALEQDEKIHSFKTASTDSWPVLKERARAMRKEPTKEEDIIWQFIRNEQLGFKIRRQHAIGNNIVDFVNLETKLVIEIDGGYHEQTKEADEQRTQELEQAGFTVIRFKNEQVSKNPQVVANSIKEELERKKVNLTEPYKEPDESYLKSSSKVLPTGEDLGGAFTQGGLGGAFTEDSGASYPLEKTTMPGWAGSSWYYLRYMDPHNADVFASKDKMDYWKDIDLYIGGSEHGTGHLLYFRFWTKFLKDLGYIDIEEPTKKLVNQGMIQGVSQKIFLAKGVGSSGSDSTKGGIEVDKWFNFEVTGRYDLNKVLSEIRFEIEKTKELYYESLAISAELLEDTSGFYQNNIPIGLVENGKLNVKHYSEYLSQLTEVKRIDIYVCKNGYYLNDKPYWYEDSDKSSKIEFHTFPVVEKMSKRWANVVNPDDVIDKYGADCFRMYEMFLGPIELSKPWDTQGIDGVSRFLRKFWRLFYEEDKGWLVTDEAATPQELKVLHKTIKKIEEDIERLSFNTSVSAFMMCVNELTELNCHKRAVLEPLCIILHSFAPHTTEYIYSKLGHGTTIADAKYPAYDASLLVENSFEYPVSINGKPRTKLEFALDATEEDIEKVVLANDVVLKWLEGKTHKKFIFVKGRMINVVV